MGLRIGDSARQLSAFQQQAADFSSRQQPVRSGAERGPSPLERTAGPSFRALGLAEPRSLTTPPETVRSTNAAAVSALNRNLREAREAIPSLEDRLETLRTRFEQARDQVFGSRESEANQPAEPRRIELDFRRGGELAADNARALINGISQNLAVTQARINGEEPPVSRVPLSRPTAFSPDTFSFSAANSRPFTAARFDFSV